MEFAGYTPEADWLLGIGGAFGAGSGSLHWIDPQTLDIEFTLPRIHLAVAPQEGGVYVYTLDPDELLGVVRASLTRGFTAAECARFDFDDDCPALPELQEDPSTQG